MKESNKSKKIRDFDFFKTYLSGNVIDIGCGLDKVVSHAEPFDMDQGDANNILDHRPSGNYDTVYSSHCLEHMRDVPKALQGWWQLVRPGGYLIVIVPDEALYEQNFWPSLFSTEHLASFRLDAPPAFPGRNTSYELRSLASELPDCVIVSAKRQNLGYIDRADGKPLRDNAFLRQNLGRTLHALNLVGLGDSLIERAVVRLAHALRLPIDQTRGSALAQIELIVRKSSARESAEAQ